jgi:hypothetical protein
VHRTNYAAKGAAAALTAIVALSLSAVGCGRSPSGGSGNSPATPTAAVSAVAGPTTNSPRAPDVSDAPEPAAELLVLGTDKAGVRGLWRLVASGRWSLALSASAATAVARFGASVAIAGRGCVREIYVGADPVATSSPLGCPAAAPNDPVVALDRAPGGEVALVTMGEGGPAYRLAGNDGVVRSLAPAPVQPFAPVVGWLDDARLLALSTDSAQASRLVEVDVRTATFGRVGTVAGVRDFAISGDRATIALATAGEILVGSVAESLESGRPGVVAAVPEDSVTWALALDGSGRRLAFLEAVVAADGAPTGSHVLVFVNTGESWVLRLDSTVPLTEISGEAWASVA